MGASTHSTCVTSFRAGHFRPLEKELIVSKKSSANEQHSNVKYPNNAGQGDRNIRQNPGHGNAPQPTGQQPAAPKK